MCLRSFLPRSFLSVLSRLERGGEFWFLGKKWVLACKTRPEIHLPSYPGTSKATQVSPGMVRTGPIKVRSRFSKSVAASTFDFLQKNAENLFFAVDRVSSETPSDKHHV